MDTTNNNEWWGYSPKHGWVVLDRSVAENQSGSPTKLLFVKCADWSIYEENRENWEAPKYIFANNFISRLSTDDSKKAVEEVTRLQTEYQFKRRSLHTQYSI